MASQPFIPDAYSDIPLGEAGRVGASSPAAGPPLSFLDKVKLGNKQSSAGPDWGFNQMDWHESALGEVRDGLKQRGVTPIDPNASADQKPGEAPWQTVERHWRELLGQVAQVRAGDPKFLPDFAAVADKPAFDQLVRDRRNRQLEDVGREAPEGLGLAGFVGAIGHGFKDPTSFIPVGGPAVRAATIGRAILGTAMREAGANIAFTVATEPLVRGDAAKQGIDRTFTDTLFDIGAAGAAGFVIGGGFEGLRVGPAKLREALASRGKTAADGSDAEVAEIFAEAVPPDKRTPDEQAALHAIERDGEVKAASPFVPGPTGDDEHVKWLDQAMGAIHNGPPAPRTVKPVAREQIATPADAEGTRAPAREAVKAKIHRVEVSPGDDFNEASGAMGPYQFIARTWVSLFKRRYPNDPRSFEAIAALRRDPRLNDVLINDLISENAAALRHAGFDENAGNLYLAHVLGHDRAITVLRADPGARLGDLLPHDYFKGNPFRPTDTSASLIRWSYGKMGETGFPAHLATAEAAQGAEAVAAGEGDPQVELHTGRYDVEAMFGEVAMTDRPVLNPALFASPEEHASAQVRFERERDMAEGFAPVMSRAEAFSPYEHFDALRRYRGTVTPDAIGEQLGLNPDEVRKAVRTMQSLDRNSPFILARERGSPKDAEPTRIMRRPKGSQSLIEFLAAEGGIRDSDPNGRYKGGDLKSMDVDVGRRFRKPLINNESGMGMDDALRAAVEAGYFPGIVDSQFVDTQVLLDAIDAELRGERQLPVDQALDAAEAARRARYGEEPPPEAEPMTAEAVASAGFTPEEFDFARSEAAARGLDFDDEALVEALDRYWNTDQDIEQAFTFTALSRAYRTLDEAAAETGNGSYVIDPDERFAGDDGLPERRDIEPGDLEFDAGGGGPESVADGAAESRAGIAQSAHDPAAAQFGDPAGVAAEAQADSLIHDLEMAVHGQTVRAVLDRKDRMALRLRWLGEQRQKLGEAAAMDRLREAELADQEPWLDPDFLLETYRDDPDGGAAILEAIAEHGELQRAEFRLDEEGGESDLASILDEINEAQKAATEMRNCLKPKGGEE